MMAIPGNSDLQAAVLVRIAVRSPSPFGKHALALSEAPYGPETGDDAKDAAEWE